MKDKEKQIEEMACLIYGEFEVRAYSDTEKKHFENRIGMNYTDYQLEIAQALYNAGYRKLPEDSVVLSREEYEKLKNFEYRVRSGVCMTQKEWFDFCNEDSNRRTCLRIEEREKERKETAEKIFAQIDKDLCECTIVNEGGYGWNYQGYEATDLRKRLTKLAKQFGVEIKES